MSASTTSQIYNQTVEAPEPRVSAKRGCKPGFIRPKAPSAVALDLPFLTLADGTHNTKWYVGESRTRFGTICKCWVIFDFTCMADKLGMSVDDVSKLLTADELSMLAKPYFDANREKILARQPDAVFTSPEDDLAYINECKAKGTLPSTEQRKAKDRRTRERKAAEAGKSGVIKSNGKKAVKGVAEAAAAAKKAAKAAAKALQQKE